MIEQFITYVKDIRGYSLNTCRAYERDLRKFASWMQNNLAEARWSKVTREEIDRYVVFLAEAGEKPSTTNRQLSSIASIYNYFIRQGWLKANPCKYESRRKLAEVIPGTIPTKDLQRAYDHAQGCTKLMIGILATTGIRLQEMLDIRWRDIDLSECSIIISGKGNVQRKVFSTPEVLEPLKNLEPSAKPDFKLFWISPRKVRYLLEAAIRPYTKADKISPHIIRHTYATALAQDGKDALAIKQALGHKSLETSQKYVNFAEVTTNCKAFSNTIIK